MNKKQNYNKPQLNTRHREIHTHTHIHACAHVHTCMHTGQLWGNSRHWYHHIVCIILQTTIRNIVRNIEEIVKMWCNLLCCHLPSSPSRHWLQNPNLWSLSVSCTNYFSEREMTKGVTYNVDVVTENCVW